MNLTSPEIEAASAQGRMQRKDSTSQIVRALLRLGQDQPPNASPPKKPLGESPTQCLSGIYQEEKSMLLRISLEGADHITDLIRCQEKSWLAPQGPVPAPVLRLTISKLFAPA